MTWSKESTCLYDYESRQILPTTFKAARKSTLYLGKNDVTLLDEVQQNKRAHEPSSAPSPSLGIKLAEICPGKGTEQSED